MKIIVSEKNKPRFSKSFLLTIISVAMLLAAILAGTMLYFFVIVQNKKIDRKNQPTASIISPLDNKNYSPESGSVLAVADKKSSIVKIDDEYNLYKNTKLGFEIKYPRIAVNNSCHGKYNEEMIIIEDLENSSIYLTFAQYAKTTTSSICEMIKNNKNEIKDG